MNRIRPFTLLFATLFPVLASAAPEKDMPSEPRNDPREQREKLDHRREEVRNQRSQRLLKVLENAGIKKNELKTLLQNSTPEEQASIRNLLSTLTRTERAVSEVERQERLKALKTLKQLVGPQARPDIGYDPETPVEARLARLRAAMSNLPPTYGVRDDLVHVAERDSNERVRAYARFAATVIHLRMMDEFLADHPQSFNEAISKALESNSNFKLPSSGAESLTRESLRARGGLEAFSDAEIDSYLAEKKLLGENH